MEPRQKFLFKGLKRWSSLKSSQPKWNEFEPWNKQYVVYMGQSTISIITENGQVVTGQTPEFPMFKIFARDRQVQRQYRLSEGCGGAFNVFSDGTAELLSFGSGLPIIEVTIGQLVKAN